MKYSILIVDDDKLVNEFLVEAVKRQGYDCKAVYSGEEAIVAFKEKEYDIVLSDLKMKEIDGVALLKHIKKLAPETVFIITERPAYLLPTRVDPHTGIERSDYKASIDAQRTRLESGAMLVIFGNPDDMALEAMNDLNVTPLRGFNSAAFYISG